MHTYPLVPQAKAGIGAWLHFDNEESLHQTHGYRTPWQFYEMVPVSRTDLRLK